MNQSLGTSGQAEFGQAELGQAGLLEPFAGFFGAG